MANAYNGQCLVCRRSKIKLRTVKPHSISTAFIKHKIVIKRNSRICSRHLDTNGLIRQEEFHHIRTSAKEVSKQTMNELNSTLGKSLGVFEKFVNPDTLDEDHCYKITGFSKSQFRFISTHSSDHNLLRILEPQKTLVLVDRGKCIKYNTKNIYILILILLL